MNIEDILPPRQHTSPPTPFLALPAVLGEYYLETQKGKNWRAAWWVLVSSESRQIIPYEIDVVWQHKEQMYFHLALLFIRFITKLQLQGSLAHSNMLRQDQFAHKQKLIALLLEQKRIH